MEKIIIPQKITFEEAERICEKKGMTLICVSYNVAELSKKQIHGLGRRKTDLQK